MRGIARDAARMRRGSQRLEGESGQTLVEYALIIAIVALGALLALGFLSGKINSLFSKAGNSVNGVVVADGASGGSGGSSTGGPVDPPPVAGSVAISCAGGTCYNAGTLIASLTGWTGTTSYTYTWQQNGSSGEGCGGGGGWSGVGGNSPTLNGGSINVNGSQDAIRVTVVGHGSGGPDTAPVCADTVIVDTVAPSGNVNIDCPGSSCGDGETAAAVTGTWNGVPTPTLTYQWAVNSDSGASCNGTSGWVNLGTGSTQVLPNSGSGSDAIRVIVTGTNIDPGSPATDRDCTSFS
jgi:Flp pilus assembly pilin Flp